VVDLDWRFFVMTCAVALGLNPDALATETNIGKHSNELPRLAEFRRFLIPPVSQAFQHQQSP